MFFVGHEGIASPLLAQVSDHDAEGLGTIV